MTSPLEPPSEPPGMWQIEDDMLVYIADHWPHVDEEGHPE